MSSVYKKGRDGYYYYQTYVHNPESNKKDKRVFHALRTKDLEEAKVKQREFDLKYENQNHSNHNESNISSYLGLKTSSMAIIALVIVGCISINYLLKDVLKQSKKKAIVSRKNNKAKEEKINSPSDMNADKSFNKNQVNIIRENIIEKKSQPSTTAPKVAMPKYNIERVERLSGSFGQGKIFVTLDTNTNNDSQRLLCNHLMEEYSEFSNIVICLYANTKYGKELARGNNESVSIQQQKQVWLAMYSYNDVEGEYFDDNPSGYLGHY
tara:strand:- start:1579 stop:2379 length:801 start_codon:yes stop_codon:yes gene_type:complete